MNLTRYLQIRESVLAHAKAVEDSKRQSYTAGDANVLRNFASDSEFVGTSQLQNCFTHVMKQVRGIASYVQHPDVKPSESLLSRAADLINYAVLMVANAEDSGRDTGLGAPGQLLDNKMFSREWFYSSPPYKPLHKDEIFLATQAFDYNFGKDDV